MGLTEEKLKQLEELLDEALKTETPESLLNWLLYKRKKDVLYVECIDAQGTDGDLKKGNIYQVIQEDDGYYLISTRSDILFWYIKDRFKTYNNCVSSKSSGGVTNTDKSEPIPDEINIETLKREAIDKYKKGDYIKYETHKSRIGNVVEFELVEEELYLVHTDEENKTNKSRVWRNGKWAEVALGENQRWQPRFGERFWFIQTIDAKPFYINSTLWMGDILDKEKFKNYNCFKSEEMAIQVKKILLTL